MPNPDHADGLSRVELLPCPWCGGSDLAFLQGGPTLHDAIKCRPCNLFVPLTKEEWNRRAAPASPVSVPGEADPLRDALDHIMRVARQGIQPTRRLDWIEIRARYALEGKEWSRDIRETPRDSVRELVRENEKLRARLAPPAPDKLSGGKP